MTTNTFALAKPSRSVSFVVSATLVIVWLVSRLSIFPESRFPLTYALPLFIGVWTRDRCALWGMAVLFAIGHSVKQLMILPVEALPPAMDWDNYWVSILNITVGAVVAHLIINLRDRLDNSVHNVQAANVEIRAQASELSQQNEELAQQAEELEQQSEEMAEQNEELQVHSETIAGLNAELSRRGKILESLLESARLQRTEETVLTDICHAAVGMFGEGSCAVIYESQDEMLVARSGFGPDGALSDPITQPVEKTFANLIIQTGRTGSLNDTSLRPDLVTPNFPGRPPFRAVLAAPYHVAGKTFGTVSIFSEQPRQWTEEDFLLVDWLAAQIGGILETLRLQNDLRESRTKMAAALASMRDAVFISDAEGRFIEFNDAFARYYRFKSKDECYKTLAEYPDYIDVHFADGTMAPLDMWAVPRALRGETATNEEYILRRKDTGETWVGSYSFSPIRDEIGFIVGSVVVARDITDRKQAEEELRRSRDELELRVQERTGQLRRQAELLELSHEAIFVKDLDNRITFWSRGAEETYGWTKAEALGNVSRSFLKTGSSVPFDDYMSVVMKEGRWDGELVHTTKDGRQITVMSRQALRRDEAGNPTGVFEINIDITAERRLEDQFRQAHKLEAIGTLAGGVAHNFNNILAAIMGNAELAFDDLEEESRVRGNLDQIIKASIRGRDFVREILAFSRRSAVGQKALHVTPLVRETFNLLRASLPTTISMHLNVTAARDVAVADESQLQQVLMNLGTNAAQAMPDGGLIEIALLDAHFDSAHALPDRQLTLGEYIELSVRDTGSGMDETLQGRIFEPFFTTKEVGKGTGLGLSVAYGIVKGWRGTITVESQPGRGSIFRVFLPKANDHIAVAPKDTETLHRGAEKILFVDDEESLRLIAEAMLSRLGYVVTTEGDPERALSRFRDNPEAFDLVITDYTMPGMTGLTLSKEILRRRPRTPILLCTGHNDAIDEESAKAAGIQEFLMKPLTKQKLAEAIRRTLVAKTKYSK